MPGNIGADGQGKQAGKKLRSQIVHRNRQAEEQSNAKAGQRHFVREKMRFGVGEDQAQQQESEDTVFQRGQREAKVCVAGQEERAGKQLNYKIARRDEGFAVAAAAAQEQPAQDGNVVVETDGVLALG